MEKYQQEFIGFQEELRSYLYRLVSKKQDTEYIAQETYIKAFKNIKSFKENSSFKTWVFSIDPLNANGTDIHNYLIENMPGWAELQTVTEIKNP